MKTIYIKWCPSYLGRLQEVGKKATRPLEEGGGELILNIYGRGLIPQIINHGEGTNSRDTQFLWGTTYRFSQSLGALFFGDTLSLRLKLRYTVIQGINSHE